MDIYIINCILSTAGFLYEYSHRLGLNSGCRRKYVLAFAWDYTVHRRRNIEVHQLRLNSKLQEKIDGQSTHQDDLINPQELQRYIHT